MILLTKISMVITGLMMAYGLIRWQNDQKIRENTQYLLETALREVEQQKLEYEERLALEEEAERQQKNKVFHLDCKITHGSAFGGFCATANDGRKKRGSVALDKILLYGKHPAGKEFTYYIEDQNLVICASDDPDSLIIRSEGPRFEIRQNGQGRDEGELVQEAVIQRDILYYIILESKHEISIRAVKGC